MFNWARRLRAYWREVFFDGDYRQIPSADAEWHKHEGFRAVFIDGVRVIGPVMRRRVNGEWEYRRMSEVEKAEYESAEAW